MKVKKMGRRPVYGGTAFGVLLAAALLLPSGCRTGGGDIPDPAPKAAVKTAAPTRTSAPAAVPRAGQTMLRFQDAIDAALHRQLDVRITESLQEFAAEHAENSRALAAATALRHEEEAAAPNPEVRRREALEHAIGFAHLLGGGTRDLQELRRPRETQLLARQTAAALIRWRVRRELAFSRQREVELEARLLTGWDTAQLDAMQAPFPPDPYPFPTDLETLQQFAVFNRPECGHLRIHPALAGALRQAGDSRLRTEQRLIHLLYRLPLRSDSRDPAQSRVIQAAIGAAAAMQIDEDLRRLNRCYGLCRVAQLRAELEPTPAHHRAVRLAAAEWQTAYVDLLTDLGSTEYALQLPPVKPFDAPELTAESAQLMELLAKEEDAL